MTAPNEMGEVVRPAPRATEPYPDAASHLFEYLERAAWTLDDRAQVPVSLITDKDARIAAREDVTTEPLPLLALRTHAGLDLPATHVLVLAAITGLDVVLGERLSTKIAGVAPTVQELVEILSFAAEDEAVVLAAFAPDAPLRALGLIELGGVERTPLLQRPVYVDDRIVAFLRGDRALDPGLREVASLHTGAESTVDASTLQTLRHLLGTPGPILIEGPAQVGKTTAAIAAVIDSVPPGTSRGPARPGLAAHRRRAIVVDMELVAAEQQPLPMLERVRREAILQDATLVLRVRDSFGSWSAPLVRAVTALVQAGTAIVTMREADALARLLRGPRRVKVSTPSTLEQQRIWRLALGPLVGLSPSEVCERYPLPPGDILLAAAAARARSEVERRAITSDDLLVSARGRLCHRLGDVAELVSTTLGWDDLVLRDDVSTRILEIVAAVRFRDQVMGQWGFSDKLPYGRSVSALFSGAPGTGKTMVATLIGRELGLEVFRVDLSKVVSKYIGETEKNLARVFEEASRCRAVILFDEADSLFAKRTEVKSSNDRYANLEVNFLLQKLEAHDGIVILTTNAATAIDAAFLRRLRYRVEFPEPDENERTTLWRSMIPKSAPLAADVDFAALGRRFRLTGGHIKNAVVRAAYLAAGEGIDHITQDALVRAATLEWTELGNLPGT